LVIQKHKAEGSVNRKSLYGIAYFSGWPPWHLNPGPNPPAKTIVRLFLFLLPYFFALITRCYHIITLMISYVKGWENELWVEGRKSPIPRWLVRDLGCPIMDIFRAIGPRPVTGRGEIW